MQEQLNNYIEKIKQDYIGWRGASKNDTVKQNMDKEFCEGIETSAGKKFIKVTTRHGVQKSVHSFIVKTDFTTSKGVRFKQGDILKAASWANPALNAPRGNIFGDYIVKWTGALYMNNDGTLAH